MWENWAEEGRLSESLETGAEGIQEVQGVCSREERNESKAWRELKAFWILLEKEWEEEFLTKMYNA